jgi:hypothetical protein
LAPKPLSADVLLNYDCQSDVKAQTSRYPQDPVLTAERVEGSAGVSRPPTVWVALGDHHSTGGFAAVNLAGLTDRQRVRHDGR